jgi:hypothetical protein
VVEHWPSKYKAFISNPSITRKERTKKSIEREEKNIYTYIYIYINLSEMRYQFISHHDPSIKIIF